MIYFGREVRSQAELSFLNSTRDVCLESTAIVHCTIRTEFPDTLQKSLGVLITPMTSEEGDQALGDRTVVSSVMFNRYVDLSFRILIVLLNVEIVENPGSFMRAPRELPVIGKTPGEAEDKVP